MLYPPGIIVVLSRQLCLCLLSAVRVRTVCIAFCVSTPSVRSEGTVCVVKSVGGSLQVPRIRRAILQSRQRDRPARRLRVDDSIEASLWRECDPTILVSKRLWRRRLSVEDAGLDRLCRKSNAAEFGKSADGELQIGLNGRSVSRPSETNESTRLVWSARVV